jgi:hypothetical protein
LIIPGMPTFRIYVVDTKPHPTQAKISGLFGSRFDQRVPLIGAGGLMAATGFVFAGPSLVSGLETTPE